MHRFFQYACGTWNKMHVIPEDKSSISTFEVMADQLQVVLKAQLGGWPVLSSNWTAPSFSVETLLGIIRSTYNEGYVIEQWVGPDDKDSSANILQIDQSVLALPSRDYYLKLSSRGDLDAYHKYMTNIAILLGANSTTAAKELLEIMEFERKLANASLPEQDRHDTSLIYNKMTLRDLSRLVPQIRWLEYFRTIFDIEINENENIVTYGLPYFVELGRILATTKRRTIHNYVIWRLVMSLSSFLIDDYQKERVEFRQILQGVLSERHRWSQCVEWVNKKMGMAVGVLYVRDHFDPDSKETALEMIHTIREAFNELLVENEWMDEGTKKVAKEKPTP
nr:unnamed protein product [Callosobruchus chinensis]